MRGGRFREKSDPQQGTFIRRLQGWGQILEDGGTPGWESAQHALVVTRGAAVGKVQGVPTAFSAFHLLRWEDTEVCHPEISGPKSSS